MKRASHEEMENYISSPLAPLRKVFLLRKEIQNDQT